MGTKVTEHIPPAGQYLSELEIGDWFHVRPTNQEAAAGLRERTLCVLVVHGTHRGLHQNAIVFVPSLSRSFEMKYGRALDPVDSVLIYRADRRPDNPAREVRERAEGGVTEDGHLADA